MPTYEYHCEDCKEVFEVAIKFGSFLSEVNCPKCKSKKIKKKLNNPSILYRGDGWGKDKKHE
jgi:putative FmdB family regulatory protein